MKEYNKVYDKIINFKSDKFKEIIKKLNGTTRRGKCARDLHDKIIQDRDNDVQLTAVEVEESTDVVNVDRMKKTVLAMMNDKKLNIKKDEIPSPLEIEQFSIDNKINLSDNEIDYINQEWDNISDVKV